MLIIQYNLLIHEILTCRTLLFVTDGNGLTCFDVDLHTPSNDYTWFLGECHSAEYSRDAEKYKDKCCIPNGDHLLSCKSSQNAGWINAFVTIKGHTFCDDIVGVNKFTTINIPGK